jgi:hypothetical protein
MKTKSQVKSQKIVFITLVIIIVLPLTIWMTTLLLNKPKVSKNINAAVPAIVTPKNNENVIDSIIKFGFTAPNQTWKSKVINETTNPTSLIKSLEFQITNGTSTMNIVINEVDLRLKNASAIDTKILNSEYDSKYLGYIEIDTKPVEILSNELSTYSRVTNPKTKTSQLIIDTKSTVKPKDKPIKYNSTLSPFIGYSQDFRLYNLNTLVTYSQDTEENYLIMDQIFKTLRYLK